MKIFLRHLNISHDTGGKKKDQVCFFLLLLGCTLNSIQYYCVLDYSDSDSDLSSIERREPLYSSSNDTFSKLSRKSATQKRSRKKRTAIPVATPKVPSFNLSSNGSSMTFSSVPGQLSSFYSEETSSEIKNGLYTSTLFYSLIF